MGGGGKSGGGGGKAKDYFGDIAGVLACGPLYGIQGLLVDDKLVWPVVSPWVAKTWLAGSIVAHGGKIWETPDGTSAEPPAGPWIRFIRRRADLPNPYKITVEGFGEAFVYWGTDDQVLDTVEENVLAPRGHPPYRHQAMIVVKRFLFGRERTSAPNLSLIAVRQPQQSIITGTATDLDPDFQCNPWVFLAEVMTHPIFGLGLPDGRFRADEWQTVANWARDNAPLTYLSPVIEATMGVRGFVSELLNHCAGWLRWDADARIEAGRWLVNEAPPTFDASTTIDFHDLVDDAEWSADVWQDVTTSAEVVFRDAAAAFKDRQMSVPNPLATLLSGRVKARKVQRPYITRADQALAIATIESKLFGDRARRGALSVRVEKGSAIQPGSNLLLTHDAIGESIVCRCTERSIDAPPSGTLLLQYEQERGISGTPHQPTVTPHIPSGPPAIARPENHQYILLTPELAPEDGDWLATLAARSDPTTNRMDVWFRKDSGDAFQRMISVRQFGVYGTVNVPVDLGDATVDILISSDTPSGDLDAVLVPQTDDQVVDDTLLLCVIRASAPTSYECMSISQIAALGGGVYEISVERARRGTSLGGDGSYIWPIGSKAWIVARADLLSFTHARFESLLAGVETATMRITPSSAWRQADVADVYDSVTNPAGLTVERVLRFGLPDFDPSDFDSDDFATS